MLDARHRVHARVEDNVRTTKDTGLGHLPSKSWDVNTAWCHAVTIAVDLLAWFRLLGLTGDLAIAEPATLRYRVLTTPARITRGQRHRWPRLPKHWPWANALADAITKIRRIPMPTHASVSKASKLVEISRSDQHTTQPLRRIRADAT